ncbi:MAG TPA: hypothetical protein VKZ65_02745, partial [Glycomyces sp.]|nr:hypothetical protein [Glycomyces sp.]
SVWRNLQYLRGTLHGMETALAEAASGGEEAEADAAALFTSTEAGLDQGVPPGGAAEERLAPYESAPDDAGGDVVGLGGTETGADGTTAVGV